MTGALRDHHRHDRMALTHGTSGPDLFPGSDQQDDYNGRRGDDTIYGQGDDDALWGGRGDDWIDGGAGSDDIHGDGRPNTTAAKGRDTLNGGTGNDVLWGGPRSDTFVFDTGSEKDLVADFEPKGKQHDIVDLGGLEGVHNFDELMQFADRHYWGMRFRFADGDVLELIHNHVKLDESQFLFA